MERPTGVTILAVLGFIATGLLVLAALVVLLGGAMVANMAARPGMGMIAGIGGAIIGVALLGFAVLYAVVGIAFLKLQNWARILVIVLCGLGVLFNGLGVLTALFHFHVLVATVRAIVVAVDLWVALYLLKPHVKQAFGATGF
ncbi:MAG TPA: hypothetical protein VNV41_20610 [Candidatus Acidoferrales bacterium]|nr:hypothetical protein [Candidatus Acidoferrales bacterium]